MGWTTISKYELKNEKTDGIKQFLMDEWERNSDYEVVGCSKVGSTVYMAIKRSDGVVFANIVLTSFSSYDFEWKEMQETMMPYKFDCPKKILDMLTPTDNEYANDWRQRCLDAKAKTRQKFNDGDIIQFDDTISFTNGYESDKFVLCVNGRKTTFSKYYEGSEHRVSAFRITKWKQKEFKVIGNIFQKEKIGA